MKVVQISSKKATTLSPETRAAIADRDLALMSYKDSKDPEDLRLYKTWETVSITWSPGRNLKRKTNTFQAPDQNLNDRWKKIKTKFGQDNFVSPQFITEKEKTYTSHQGISESLNRQYVKSVKKLRVMESTP